LIRAGTGDRGTEESGRPTGRGSTPQ